VTVSNRRRSRNALEKERKKWPRELAYVPSDQWPDMPDSMKKGILMVLRSRDYLVQVHMEPDRIVRLTVCRTSMGKSSWSDNIPWDDLQRLKREAGYGGHAAVEIFPPDGHEVNVANMRHLWVLPESPKYMWRGDDGTVQE
jgi:hypothetical protein